MSNSNTLDSAALSTLDQLMKETLDRIDSSQADRFSMMLYFAAFWGFTVALIFFFVRDRYEFPALGAMIALYLLIKLWIGGRGARRRREFIRAAIERGVPRSAAARFWGRYDWNKA